MDDVFPLTLQVCNLQFDSKFNSKEPVRKWDKINNLHVDVD
jgi:hypothetical protein